MVSISHIVEKKSSLLCPISNENFIVLWNHTVSLKFVNKPEDKVAFYFSLIKKALPIPSYKFNVSTEKNVPVENGSLSKTSARSWQSKRTLGTHSFSRENRSSLGSFLSLSRYLVSSYNRMHHSLKKMCLKTQLEIMTKTLRWSLQSSLSPVLFLQCT